MQRRSFLAATGGLGLGALAAGSGWAQEEAPAEEDAGDSPAPAEPAREFKLKYAPHFGMLAPLAGGDKIKQLEFAAAQGFTAWEHNTMKRESVDEQQQIAEAMERLGITMGVFVAYGIGSFGKVSFAGSDKKLRREAVAEVRESIDIAKRVRAKWMTVVPGAYNNGLEEGYQTARCVELLRTCAGELEPHGLVMVLEPLNWWANHPGLFLRKTAQAYEICQAVGSPACKILFDIYHQQIQEGNLIPNIDMAWDEIAYFQCGDNPGRKEPGTGEINYRNVFRHLHAKGFDGIMGMEHGVSRRGAEGAQALIDAYVAADDF